MSTPIEEAWEKNPPKFSKINNKIWDTVWKEGAAEVYVESQKSAAKMLKQPFEFNPKQVTDYYNKHGLELVKTLDKTDKEAFKKILGNNFNTTYKDFSSGSPILENKSKFRRIWDTERHNALTHGYDDFVNRYRYDTGAKITKTWRHSGNPNPRPHHIAMDGITIDYEETFPNGEDIPEGINCGCWLEYREYKPGEKHDIEAAKIEYDNNMGFIDVVNDAEEPDEIQWAWTSRHPEVTLDIDGMNMELAKRQTINLDRLLKDVPIPEKEIFNHITSLPKNDIFWWRPTGSNTYAATVPGEIIFNEGFFGKTPSWSLKKTIEHDIATGFHPKGFSPEWITTHEVGHRVFDHLVITDQARAKEIFEVALKARKSGELIKWGEYAASEPTEGIAEIFAAIYHVPAQDQPWFVKDIAHILTRD